MSSRTRLALLLVAVVLLLGVAVLTVSAVYAGGFAFFSDGIEVAGKLCSSGCSI